jgi:hypothetical protein
MCSVLDDPRSPTDVTAVVSIQSQLLRMRPCSGSVMQPVRQTLLLVRRICGSHSPPPMIHVGERRGSETEGEGSSSLVAQETGFSS